MDKQEPAVSIGDVARFLEAHAPLAHQEGYDNAGLIVGDPSAVVTGVVVCLDSTEAVVEEAVGLGCNLIIAHHPIVFSGLKQLTGKNYVQRTVIKAIKNDVAIYAIHTNLDNAWAQGVNTEICRRLGIEQPEILVPKHGILRKLSVFVPVAHAEALRQALFAAGAGAIGDYDQCSFNTLGTGSFRAGEGSTPFVGEHGKLHYEAETKVEVVYSKHLEWQLLSQMRAAHPYETIAYDLLALENAHPRIGAGMIGQLPEPIPTLDFLQRVKTTMRAEALRYTRPLKEAVSRIAVCGGSGSEFLPTAKAAGAEVFLTADFKYHQFFDADGTIVIADIGHYESEQFTIDLLATLLREKFSTFALHLTTVNTNPVNYL